MKEVEILDVAVNNLDDSPLGLLFHAKWTAMGSVGHWGHIHFRKNQYKANISVEPVDDAWRITGLELLEEKRIDPYANPARLVISHRPTQTNTDIIICRPGRL